MSDFQAIGAVSTTLQRLLRDRMELPLGVSNAPVTISSLQGMQNGAPEEEERVNLFLYRVTENGALKNQEIVGQGHPGAYGHPPLSLDLHYLLTAYGTTSEDSTLVNESISQQLLGSAMRVLHDHPIITADLRDAQDQSYLEESLHHEYERVKINLDPLSLEDLSKVWTALNLPFRLSAAYTVSVVQIESQRRRRLALPVRTRRLHVAALRRPEITDLYRTPSGPGEPIGDRRLKIGDPMTIEGLNFEAAVTEVRLGDLAAVPSGQISLIADRRIELVVPDEPLLQPGPQVAEVRTVRDTEVVEGGLDKGTVVEDAMAQASNQTVFLVVPEIDTNTPPSATSGGSELDLVTVNGERLYREGLRSALLLDDRAFEVREPGSSDPWAAPTATQIVVPVPKLATGTYGVRMRVNGAESTEEGVSLSVS